MNELKRKKKEEKLHGHIVKVIFSLDIEYFSFIDVFLAPFSSFQCNIKNRSGFAIEKTTFISKAYK